MNNQSTSELTSKTVNISKIVHRLQDDCQIATGGWDSVVVKNYEKKVEINAMNRWIELTFSNGLEHLKKAETIARLKENYYIEMDDINHAFILHKNGIKGVFPDPEISSDLIPTEISNQINGTEDVEWNKSSK